VALYLLYRGLRDRRYFRHIAERFGFLPDSIQTTGAGSIWLHAVSVGEVLSSVELLRYLRRERPRVQLYVSTTTLMGRAVAKQKLDKVANGVFYAPLDYRSCVRRVLRRLQPSLVIVLETEIWPNLYREAKRSGASLVVVNGRISTRALPSYVRSRWFFRNVLCWPDAILTQASDDAERYKLVGAPADHVRAAGNLKYDFRPPPTGITAELSTFLDTVHPLKTWIAASTMPPATPGDIDEDDVVIDAFQQITQIQPDLLLILAPRKPEHFHEVAAKLAAALLPFVRRSELSKSDPPRTPCVLLLDSIGELAALFGKADVVFMGGTLAQRGGHNILEPAYFGKPIVTGPHMENFAEIAAEFTRANALRTITSSQQLAGVVSELLINDAISMQLGENARELTASKRGVVLRLGEELWRFYDEAVPVPIYTLPARIFLTPLSWIWLAGSRWKQSRNRRARRSLQAPVISIGALTMGGAGKTPLVNHLAERLHTQGHAPAILTRGYKRRSAQPVVLVERGNRATLDLTGDEAQLFIRGGHAHVGIARNRYEAGAQVEEQMAPDMFLLDDGFQHVKLARKHDVVLIDALDPYAGGLFPLGRRREPMESLRRATAIIVTRADFDHSSPGMIRMLRRFNPSAPIFRSRVIPYEWVDASSGDAIPVKDFGRRKAAAFCGLGNPNSFWATLEELGLEVTYRWVFGDHHSYHPTELERVAEQARRAGADVLVTTEKDSVNLPQTTAEIVRPFPLFWLRIGIEIEREEELLKLLS